MCTKDKKHLGIKKLVTVHLILLNLWGTAKIENRGKTYLAGQHLQSIGLDSVKRQLRSLLKQRSFKHAIKMLKVLSCSRSFCRNTGGVSVSLLTGGHSDG